MSYSFVAAKYYTPGGMVEPRAIVIHFAEGGGTVSWLTHPTNDNSSHFVIEYSGRIVQMVKDADAGHSLHVGRPYGPPAAGDSGIFSLDVAKAVLGSGIGDPNAYIFAVEIEGYAANGPNPAQATSLGALVHDLHARHPSVRGLLGHRDFQNYKVCPGGRIPWAALGGHGLFVKPPVTATGGDMLAVVRDITRFKVPRTLTTKVGVLNGYDPARPGKVVKTVTFTNASPASFDAVVSIDQSPDAGVTPHGAPFLHVTSGTFVGLYVVAARVTANLMPDAVPTPVDTSPFTQVDVDAKVKAAVAADRLKAHITWQA